MVMDLKKNVADLIWDVSQAEYVRPGYPSIDIRMAPLRHDTAAHLWRSLTWSQINLTISRGIPNYII